MSSLHEAARNGDKELLSRLLGEGADPDLPESEVTIRIPAMLLEQGDAEVEAAGFSFGRTPLMLAVMGGHLTIIELLLQARARTDRKDVAGWTAFGLACREGFLEAAQALVSAGDKVKQRLPGTSTGLHHAAEGGHVLTVLWLLSQGAAIDARNSRGETALLLAGRMGQLSVVEALLNQGADPGLAAKDGRTALSSVVANLQRVKLPKGASQPKGCVSMQWTDEGVFALVPVPEEQTLVLTRRLLDAGASASGEGGNAALASAAQFGLLQVAQLLLERGADPNAPSGPLQMTARETAELSGHQELVRLFESGPRTV